MKKFLRLIILVIFIMLSACGLALPVSFNRDRLMDRKSIPELIKEQDENEEEQDLKDVKT